MSHEDEYNRLLKQGDLEGATEVAQKMKDREPTEPHQETSGSYTDIKGVGEEIADEIRQKYGPYEDFVEEADVEGLTDIAGIGETSAQEIIDQLE